MGDKSGIEWTDATWNPIAGCSIVSPGCTNCYAMKMAARIERMSGGLGRPTHYAGLTMPTKAGAVWNGKIARAPREILEQPLRWSRPRRVFVNSMSDLFHEGVSDETIDRVFAIMALTPRHTYQVLTKRSARMRDYFAERWQGTPAQRIRLPSGDVLDIPAGGETGRRHQVEAIVSDLAETAGVADTENDAHWTAAGQLKAIEFEWPLPNVWLGVSTEDQARADERIPHLLDTPAAVRWISAEPLLGPIDLRMLCTGHYFVDALCGEKFHDSEEPTPTEKTGKLDWIVAGGESGPGSRPCHPNWARSLRDQCATARVPFFWKQWGDWRHDAGTIKAMIPPGTDRYIEFDGAYMERVGKRAAGATLDGREHREFPT